MYLLDNPVLQRELVVNLRMARAFVLLFAYVALLGIVVYVAWPNKQRLDLTTNPEEAKQLVNLFFLGQYTLISLMAPSFAGGAITGEKERRTYEMLLASPMRPGAIVLGKLLAALCHLAVLVFASLPIVVLCLPLGGVHWSEVLATYVAMAFSVVAFGMICLTASSYFTRTIASLVVSYLIILPMALFGVVFYSLFEEASEFRLFMLTVVFPGACLALCVVLFAATSRRLLHPPDVGSEAQEVVDLEQEQQTAVGMVIRSDQFPDKLFAPPKRTDLMADHINPVYDKEMRSELFGQGTLMLRLVIQLSMFLALPLMAVCLYMWPYRAPWYTSYVLVFNMLVGPVFSAGTITSERERQTLELLLTTTVSPWQILWGKLLSSLRVSCVLTGFLAWPLLLAWLLPPWTYLPDTITMIGYVVIIGLTSVTTTVLATSCSVVLLKTTVSMMTSYVLVIVLFALPPAVDVLANLLFPARAALVHVEPSGRITEDAAFRLVSAQHRPMGFRVEAGERLQQVAEKINNKAPMTGVPAGVDGNRLLIGVDADPIQSVRFDLLSGSFRVGRPATVWIGRFTFTSPFSAAFSLPLHVSEDHPIGASWFVFFAFVALYLTVNGVLIWGMLRLFDVRWRVRA